MVETFGEYNNVKATELITEKFDMRPAAIIERFDMLRPIYKKTACYGHFGREDFVFPWEEIFEF